jgi:hypothetical protein
MNEVMSQRLISLIIMDLKKELRNFIDTFGRKGTDIGNPIFNGNSDKVNQLNLFYETLLFNKVLTIGGTFFINIIPQSNLTKAQEGWYNILTKDNNWITDDNKWNKDWIVFANRNDDAIYCNNTDNCVYGTIDKTKHYKLGNSIAQFIHILIECMKLEEDKYNFETNNEDEELKSEFLDDVYSILNNISDAKTADDFMEFFFE